MKVLANDTSVIIAPNPPVIDPEGIVTSDYWRWLNSNNGRLYRYENGEWVLIGVGITGSKTVGGFEITFEDGLLTGFEAL